MIISYPASYKGYIRLADISRNVDPKVSLLAFAQAVRYNDGMLELMAKHIRGLREEALYGSVISSEERDRIPPDLRPHLVRSFPSQLNEKLSTLLWTAQTASRHRVEFDSCQLPRFFSWLYPGRIAGMSTPKNERDIAALIEMGFTHILSLTAEEPLDEAWFRLKPVDHIFVPIDNLCPPTFMEMDTIYRRMKQGGTWLVHCGGGVGRAGTVLACLIAMLGLDGPDDHDEPRLAAKEAIKYLRQARPRSLESERQETFVQEWVKHRWGMAHALCTQLSEPVTVLTAESKITSRLSLDGSKSTAIIFIGIPGSGKSWLSSAISKRRPKGKTIIVSQDDSGSRRTCENEFGRSYSTDTLLILDRCNPTVEDRKYWLSLCQAGRRIAVFFDYTRELCLQRVD